VIADRRGSVRFKIAPQIGKLGVFQDWVADELCEVAIELVRG